MKKKESFFFFEIRWLFLFNPLFFFLWLKNLHDFDEDK